MVERRSHAGGAVILSTAAPFGSGSGSFSATGTPLGWPDGSGGPFSIRVAKGLPNEEKLYVVSRTGDTFVVAQHGYDDTTEMDHGAGETIELVGTALELDEANAHIMADTAVHGLGAGVHVVGDTTVQTLQGKVIDGGHNTLQNIPRVASPQLMADITALTTALATEISNRAAGDTTNAAAIAAEATTRAGADTTIAGTVTTEVARASAAEALKAPIASPVFTGTVTLPGDSAGALQAVTQQQLLALLASRFEEGVTTATPDANGNITINHGAYVPAELIMQEVGPSANGTWTGMFRPVIRSLGNGSSVVHCFHTADGTPVASGSVTVHWIAVKP